ncbi:MAG: hypothetical protein ACD_37C00299G0001, partial [uncultured bacterium]
MAKNRNESAKEKKEALKDVGAIVADTFSEFVGLIKTFPISKVKNDL